MGEKDLTEEGNMSSTAVSPGCAAGTGQMLARGFKSSFVPDTTPIVFVLDENASVRESLEHLIRREGWRSAAFESADEFFSLPPVNVPNCLLLDAGAASFDAFDLQRRVAADRLSTSIIFMAARINVGTAVKAMKSGAVEVFKKPIPEDALVSAIREALKHSRTNLAREALRSRYSGLSRREREVMALVTSGLLNKQVGGELGISEITVKKHRGRVMQKMQANSIADLVKMAEKISFQYLSGIGGFEA